MIRYPYIYNQVLQVYRGMDSTSFSICTYDIFVQLPNCKALTCQEFATIDQCTVLDVIILYESRSGCTHHDIADDRYLILWNEDCAGNNADGGRLWIKVHELGHVILKHLPLVAEPMLAENGFNNLTAPESESEADQFIATLLCPMPLHEILRIESPSDIKRVFGLSKEASEHRWSEYVKWTRYHRKTAWENDMRRIYLQKGITN